MDLNADLYDTLHEGMSIEEVLEVMGSEGELLSRETAQIEPGIKMLEQVTTIYEWRDDNNHAIRLMFVRDRLHDKSQSGINSEA